MSGFAPELVRLAPSPPDLAPPDLAPPDPVPPDPAPLAPPDPAPPPPTPPPVPPPLRHDGWTPDRQVRFLAEIADGALVRDACAAVGLTPTAAYSFRRRAGGAAFALGWAAANLHARERLADQLLERAIDGQVETITRADGQVIERHRYDNRLAQAMLARLDRLAAADPPAAHADPRHADPRPGDPLRPHPAADPREAARTVATGFDAWLDLIAEDAGPARLRLFVDATHAAASGCAPALAFADRRLHGADAAEAPPEPPATPAADIPDPAPAPDPFQTTSMTTSPPPPRDHVVLDPADRAAWTATDWARAEAGGLVRLATPPAPAAASPPVPPAPPASPAPPVTIPGETRPRVAALDPALADQMMTTPYGRMQLLAHALERYGDEPVDPAVLRDRDAREAAEAEAEVEDSPPPVVWRESRDVWRTSFPPPPDYDGDEEFDYGDPDYNRTLTIEEQEIAERYEAAHPERVAHALKRDAWFNGGGAPVETAADEEEP